MLTLSLVISLVFMGVLVPTVLYPVASRIFYEYKENTSNGIDDTLAGTTSNNVDAANLTESIQINNLHLSNNIKFIRIKAKSSLSPEAQPLATPFERNVNRRLEFPDLDDNNLVLENEKVAVVYREWQFPVPANKRHIVDYWGGLEHQKYTQVQLDFHPQSSIFSLNDFFVFDMTLLDGVISDIRITLVFIFFFIMLIIFLVVINLNYEQLYVYNKNLLQLLNKQVFYFSNFFITFITIYLFISSSYLLLLSWDSLWFLIFMVYHRKNLLVLIKKIYSLFKLINVK